MRAAPENKTGQGRDLFPRAHDCLSTNRDSSGDTSNAAVLGIAHRGGIDRASSPLAVSRAIILRHMRRDVDGNVRAGRDAMEGRSNNFRPVAKPAPGLPAMRREKFTWHRELTCAPASLLWWNPQCRDPNS